MKNRIFGKGLAFGIVVLFVIVSFIPSISGNIKQSGYAKDAKNEIETIGSNAPLPTDALLTRDFDLMSNNEKNMKPGDVVEYVTEYDSGDLDTPLFDFVELMNDSGQTAWGLSSADFNNDGNMDFAVTYADSPLLFSHLSIFYNDGQGMFTKDDVYNFFDMYIKSITSGDFDNDGDIDIIYSYNEVNGQSVYIYGLLRILYNDGANHFAYSKLIAKRGSGIPYDPEGRINMHITSADYDMDGDIDLLVGDNSGAVEFYLNDGSANFTTAGIIHDYGTTGLTWGLTSADFDSDGDIDFLVAARVQDYYGHIWFKQNMMIESLGSIVFESSPGEIIADIDSSGDIQGTASLTSIDYNNDGNMEFIAGIGAEAYLFVNKEGVYEPFYVCALPDGTEGYADELTQGGMTSSDYDNDGYMDFVMGGIQSYVRLSINNHVLAVITKPKDGYFYKDDEEQYQIFKSEGVLVIGKITIQAKELEELEKVEFYINNRLKYTDTEPPYEWLWNDFSLGRYVVKIVAYSLDGSSSSKHEMIVWKVQGFTAYNINRVSQSHQSNPSPQSQPGSQQIFQLFQNLILQHQTMN